MCQLLPCLFLYFLFHNVTYGLYNAALYKPAVQSTTYEPWYAYLAVDGNRDSNLVHYSCHHSQAETMPWWMVDLRGQFVVDRIILTNRFDWCWDRLVNFQIDIFEQDPRKLANFPDISGKVCYKQVTPSNQETHNVTCPTPIIGRYVRLFMKISSQSYLHTCEMQVMVSDFLNDESLFIMRLDTRLSASLLDTVTVSSPTRCVVECLARRSSPCTAFNWVTTSNTCQLFSVNPYLNLTSNLTSSPGTNFYIQNNYL